MSKTEKILTEHYGGEVKIWFYPNSHRYKEDGEKTYLIGVTTATGMLDKSGPLLIWSGRLIQSFLLDVLESGELITAEHIEVAIKQPEEEKKKAGDKGSQVHDWCEAWIKGEDPAIPEDPQVKSGAMAFLDWVQTHEVRFLSSEKRVYSKRHKYVGTMDVEFTMGIDENGVKEGHGIIHVGDFKTSSGFYADQAFQVSAYQHASTEEHGTVYGKKYLIRLDKETGEFHTKAFTVKEHPQHLRAFLALLEVKRQMKVWDKVHNEYYKRQAKFSKK